MSAAEDFPRGFDLFVTASNGPAPQIVIPSLANIVYIVTAVNAWANTTGIAYDTGVFIDGNFIGFMNLPATANSNAQISWQGKVSNPATISCGAAPGVGVTVSLEVQGYSI